MIVKRLWLLNLQCAWPHDVRILMESFDSWKYMAKSDFSYNLNFIPQWYHIKYAYVSLSAARKPVRCLVSIIMKIDSKHIRIKLCVVEVMMRICEWRKKKIDGKKRRIKTKQRSSLIARRTSAVRSTTHLGQPISIESSEKKDCFLLYAPTPVTSERATSKQAHRLFHFYQATIVFNLHDIVYKNETCKTPWSALHFNHVIQCSRNTSTFIFFCFRLHIYMLNYISHRHKHTQNIVHCSNDDNFCHYLFEHTHTHKKNSNKFLA